MALVLVAVLGFSAVTIFGHEAACNAYAVGIPIVDDERVRVGDYIIRDHSYRDRDPCNGEDLWHYDPRSLSGIDGVLFSDCEISWVSGGRSSADDIGLPCPAQ
ncbi:MAG: hypothetical protein AAGA65_23880 [Actinomycetota bacterium]